MTNVTRNLLNGDNSKRLNSNPSILNEKCAILQNCLCLMHESSCPIKKKYPIATLKIHIVIYLPPTTVLLYVLQ